jgi:hypothetical protein
VLFQLGFYPRSYHRAFAHGQDLGFWFYKMYPKWGTFSTQGHVIIVDGRNVWQQYLAAEHGFTCHAIGRPSISFTD